MLTTSASDTYLDTALEAVGSGRGFERVLDELPVPVYVTDAAGLVTFWNRACIDFAGRVPETGKDRWCVTWRIYTTAGDPLPHDKCPLATAIKQRRPVRNEVAIAMRPDGSRVAFQPYPTPLFDADGTLTGAVNMLIDVSAEQSALLSEQAVRCRRLAAATYDRGTADMLNKLAVDYEENAGSLGNGD